MELIREDSIKCFSNNCNQNLDIGKFGIAPIVSTLDSFPPLLLLCFPVLNIYFLAIPIYTGDTKHLVRSQGLPRKKNPSGKKYLLAQNLYAYDETFQYYSGNTERDASTREH